MLSQPSAKISWRRHEHCVCPVPAGARCRESIASFAQRVKREPGKNIWMMGGGGAIGSFLDAGAIDELIVTVAPVMIGEGIPLMAPGRRQIELTLLNNRAFEDGVVQRHYEVRTR